jgi:O-methyltransferase
MISQSSFVVNLYLSEYVKSVSGCVIECGVWRGGMIAALADVLGSNRHYYLFDSFEGLPEPSAIDGPSAARWREQVSAPNYFDNCTADIAFARQAMQISRGQNSHTIFKGWFEDTLPAFSPAEPIALLRLDGDWFDSTMTCLKNLAPRLVSGGLILIDDYYQWEGCAKAVHQYICQHELPWRIRTASQSVCYILVP